MCFNFFLLFIFLYTNTMKRLALYKMPGFVEPIFRDNISKNWLYKTRRKLHYSWFNRLSFSSFLALYCIFVYAERDDRSRIIRATRLRSLNNTTRNFRQTTALLRLLPVCSQPEVALYVLSFPVRIKTRFRFAGQVLTWSNRRRGRNNRTWKVLEDILTPRSRTGG